MHGFLGCVDLFRRKVLHRKRETDDYNAWFADKWQALDAAIPCLETDDINSDVVSSRLSELQPDLVLDHGTSIVKDHILDKAAMALNLHWGLSPYYRGTHCTDWALINWDPYNIGVTIHRLTRDIDGGGIVAQRRAEIKPNDTLHSINMQLTCLGTALMLEAIDRLRNGGRLRFEGQDLSLGYLTYLRQWNRLLDKEIEYIEKNDLIGVMLKSPSRNERLPIIGMD